MIAWIRAFNTRRPQSLPFLILKTDFVPGAAESGRGFRGLKRQSLRALVAVSASCYAHPGPLASCHLESRNAITGATSPSASALHRQCLRPSVWTCAPCWSSVKSKQTRTTWLPSRSSASPLPPPCWLRQVMWWCDAKVFRN